MTVLGRLVSRIRFKREPLINHILVPIGLIVSLPVIAVLSVKVQIGGLSSLQETWYYPLASLYLAYMAFSAYSAYRLSKIVTRHLVDSGLMSYYWLRNMGDDDAVVRLYKSGLKKRNLPSPLTSLILCLITGGLAYPIILHMAERVFSHHAYGEEKKFLGRSQARPLSLGQGILDIAASMLTIGVYMFYWIRRFIETYNNHIELVHSRHPEPPVPGETSVPERFYPRGPILAVSMLLIGLGITVFMIVSGLPVYLPYIVGVGLITCYFSYRLSRRSFALQFLGTLAMVYFLFISTSFIGFAGQGLFSMLYKSLEQVTSRFSLDNPWLLSVQIYTNNLVPSTVALAPIIGAPYLAYAIGQAGII
ncbi:MAG: hypothetical protein F7C37_04315, partial [Desulfurococcales archaeon]|nr:hypothetical protein [Desulfurococcales archaeon]